MSYSHEDPATFLETQRWVFKRSGDELVTTCPLCEKPQHFYIHRETGLWKCHRCGASGNLYQLRQRLGLTTADMNDIRSLGDSLKPERKRISAVKVSAMHTTLLVDPEALDYCVQVRRWDEAVVRRFRIGLRTDQRGKWLAFPWWRAGECVGVKYRILPAYQDHYPQRFDREPGCESVLFNVDVLAGHEEILLASGESDALTLLTLGFENVVATTTGENSLPASAVDALAKKARVFIPFDNDAAGQKGAREVGKRIGFDRAWLVPLPHGVKDVNEFLVKGGTREAFQDLLANAIQFDIPSISTLSQALDRLEEEKTVGSWDQMADMTPWSLVNRRLGHWRPGNLIVLSGPQGTGKTTWALNVAMFWAAQRFPALVYCLEMTVEELVQHVLCAHYKISEEQVTAQVIARARQELGDWPLFLGANPRVTGRKEVLDLLGQAVRRYGLRLVVFDNLHMLARSIEHRTEEIGVITKTFKMFAMEHEVPFVMVAQPRKLQPGQVMTPWDLKDSVDIFSDADQVILLHRELIGPSRDREAVASAEAGEEENFSPLTLVRLAKARHRASRDALLYLVGGEHRFRDIGPGDFPEQKPNPRRGRQRPSGLTDDAHQE